MSLSTSLFIATQSLNAADGAIQATNNNIANSNTPGYSRQLVIFQSATPTNDGNISLGTGVVLEGFQSVRNELLQTRIEQETTAQSSANAQSTSLQQIQTLFTTSTQDIGTQMTNLFKSISGLATSPGNASSRQAVVVAGQNLAAAFNTTSTSLTSQQTALNTQVTQDVSQINQLSQQIAALNPQIMELKQAGQDGGTLQDQQNQLVLNLSKLTNVSVTQSVTGVNVTTGTGTALVTGSQSSALQAVVNSSGTTQVQDSSGTDITTSLTSTSSSTSGDLGGTLQTRDQTIPTLSTSLDTLANQFATAMNNVQTSGYDQNGTAGTKMFTIPTTVAGSAAGITMAITTTAGIAASSDTSGGGNGNLANFTAVQTTALPAGTNPTDAYANLVFNVGSMTSNAASQSSATTSSLLQLTNQRNSISGVSIDQESTNLIQYQQSYTAAARVVTTISTLFGVLMNMGN